MEAPNRLVASMVGLVVLWVVVYWLWPAQPAVRFAPGVVSAAGTPLPPPMLATAKDSSEKDNAAANPNPNDKPNDTSAATPTTPPSPAPSDAAPQPTLVARNAPAPQPAVIAPQFREYRVREGDTPARIAQRELGDAKLASAVLQANQLMSPAHLRAGRIIRLPLDPTNVQGKPVAVNSEAQGTPALPTPEYIVRKGDSLAAIARRVYGSEAKVQLLIDANKDTLADPSSIRPGQLLRVPPEAKPEAKPEVKPAD
jgi:nucleoid-associated protein YgaU